MLLIMMLLLPVLILSLLSGCSAEVVQNFETSCGVFFAKGKSPTVLSGNQYKQICQTLKNVVHYTTLYDTINRIPVYSAYKFEGLKNCKRKSSWYIEPQLDDNNAIPEMTLESTVKIPTIGAKQALDEDYKSLKGYDRGHLAPVYQANTQSCSDATFTLTNAAPQDLSFNRGKWRKTEEKVADILNKRCLPNYAYIITGVVPGQSQINQRVNVPSHFWTAYCCLDNNNKLVISGGYIGENTNNQDPGNMTIAGLETELAVRYNKNTFKLCG